MARLLETIRSFGLDSIKGRKLGIDPYGFLAGMPDVARQVEDISTTAATSASYFGITQVLTSGSSQTGLYTLQTPPYAGIKKMIVLRSSSSGTMQFQSVALIAGGSLGTAVSSVISLIRQNSVVNLISLSSALWQVTDRASSLVSSDSAGVLYATST